MEKKSYDNRRSAKPEPKESSLKEAFASEIGDMRIFLDLGTNVRTDDKMKILKRINSYNNIVDVFNLMGSFGWSLVYADESKVSEGKLITYYFKR